MPLKRPKQPYTIPDCAPVPTISALAGGLTLEKPPLCRMLVRRNLISPVERTHNCSKDDHKCEDDRQVMGETPSEKGRKSTSDAREDDNTCVIRFITDMAKDDLSCMYNKTR